jgi:hypothetical protein
MRCIFGKQLGLREIGKLQITRASHVEPDAEGYWWADMGPVNGPVLGPYGSRSEALAAERKWLITPGTQNLKKVEPTLASDHQFIASREIANHAIGENDEL